MEQVCIFGFLGINSYLDIRKGQISLGLTAVYAGLGIVYMFLNRQQMALLLMGMIPGLLLLCIGKVSGGALGLGDGLVVLVSGIYLGIWRTLEFITLALLLSAAWAGFLMMGRKKGRKACFPFVPFLLAAYAICCLERV